MGTDNFLWGFRTAYRFAHSAEPSSGLESREIPSLVFFSGLVGGYFGASWGRLGTKLIDFGSHFGPFLDPTLGPLVEPISVDFGVGHLCRGPCLGMLVQENVRKDQIGIAYRKFSNKPEPNKKLPID